MRLHCAVLVVVALVASLRAAENKQNSSPFQPTFENQISPPSTPAPAGMVWIPGGEFSMGTTDPTLELCGGPDKMFDAQPVHRVQVDPFWMDETEVTNAQFAR